MDVAAATWSLAQQIGDKLRSMPTTEVSVSQAGRFVAVSVSQVYAGMLYQYTVILSDSPLPIDDQGTHKEER